MKLLWSYIKKYKKMLVGALVLAALNQGFSLLDPQIFRLIVDNYASKADSLSASEFMSGVLLLLVGIVGVAFASRIAKNFQDYFVNVITQRVGTNLYATSVAHSFSLPYVAFEDQRSGELLSKLQKARTDSQSLIVSFVNIVFLSLVGILFVLIYAFAVHVWVGVAYVLMIPALSITTFTIGRRIKEAQRAVVKQTASLAGSTTETIRNVELVKSLGLEDQEINRLNRVNESIFGLELKKIKIVRILSFIQGTLINALRSGLLFLMLWLIFRQEISLGEFFALLFYSFFIFTPLAELANVSQQYQESRASMEQLEEVFRAPKEAVPTNVKETGPLKSVTFKNVSFSYDGINTSALHDINLTLRAGETIAFVGPSGSGKSTLVKLFVGLYKPSHGSIGWNDIESSEVSYKKLREKIGLVLQETQLFAGTIRENLLFVKPDATDEECLKSLNLASAQSVLERTGEGLDTKIGEGGIKLSGGERQRLAIARALLRSPELLIFDEATSSLDSITEKAITKTIEHINSSRKNLMTVLVAHRLSTVQHADRIYVLEKGKIVESGTHKKLISQGGLYAALFKEQNASAEPS